MRRAADGIAYSHMQFIDWYVLRWTYRNPSDDQLFDDCLSTCIQRWEEAAPCNPRGDYFAATDVAS